MYNTFTGEVAMRARAARWIRLVTAAVVGIAVGTGVSLKIPLIPVIAIPAAVLVTFLVRRKVEDEVKDERLIRMTEKAARSQEQVERMRAQAREEERKNRLIEAGGHVETAVHLQAGFRPARDRELVISGPIDEISI